MPTAPPPADVTEAADAADPTVPREGLGEPSGWTAPWAWAGSIAGAALQLAQPALWPGPAYGLLALLAWGLAGWGQGLAHHRRAWRACCAGLVGGGLGFALCGLRAAWFAAQALNPALEGPDLQITGRVTAMPQVQAASVRFRFAVEQATFQGHWPSWPGMPRAPAPPTCWPMPPPPQPSCGPGSAGPSPCG